MPSCRYEYWSIHCIGGSSCSLHIVGLFRLENWCVLIKRVAILQISTFAVYSYSRTHVWNSTHLCAIFFCGVNLWSNCPSEFMISTVKFVSNVTTVAYDLCFTFVLPYTPQFLLCLRSVNFSTLTWHTLA